MRSFSLYYSAQGGLALEWADTLVDVIILSGFAVTIHQIVHQQRQIKVLEGMLPNLRFLQADQGPGWAVAEDRVFHH